MSPTRYKKAIEKFCNQSALGTSSIEGSFSGVISVTEENSTAPDTERQIVTGDRYGRQLSRLMNAVAEPIAEQPKQMQQRPAIKKLFALPASLLELVRDLIDHAYRIKRAVRS